MGAFRNEPETPMPTVIRFNERRYLASGVNLTELFDQIPEPFAYFGPDNRLSACNLSFRSTFPVVIESEFLRRAGAGPDANQSNVGRNALARYAGAESANAQTGIARSFPGPVSPYTSDLQPEV